MSERDQSDDETQEQKKPLAKEPGDTADGTEERAAAPDEEEESEPEASSSELEERPRGQGGRGAGTKSRSGEAPREVAASAGSSITNSRAGLIAVVALGLGVAGGWFGHIAQAKAKLRADSAPAAAGSGVARGPCGVWEQKLCAGGGEQSAVCQQAKAASDLLTSSTCEIALDAVPATLTKAKAARVPCDKLTTKLCAELPPNSEACKLVKEKTPTFPTSRCTEMLGSYDQVLSNLKMIDKQMAGQGAGSPHGGARTPMPPGAAHPPHP